MGAAQSALDLASDYAKTRSQFGKPIGSFQLVQKHIVDMTMRVNAARALAYQASCAMQQGRATMECAIAKLYATEAAHEVANMALQVHGGQAGTCSAPFPGAVCHAAHGSIHCSHSRMLEILRHGVRPISRSVDERV